MHELTAVVQVGRLVYVTALSSTARRVCREHGASVGGWRFRLPAERWAVVRAVLAGF